VGVCAKIIFLICGILFVYAAIIFGDTGAEGGAG